MINLLYTLLSGVLFLMSHAHAAFVYAFGAYPIGMSRFSAVRLIANQAARYNFSGL